MTPPPPSFLVVGVGASAGGVEALYEFFAHAPARSGCAYIVILHPPPAAQGPLATSLRAVTSIPVTPVSERARVEPDQIYLVPPGQGLAMRDGELLLSPDAPPAERHAPLDHFFHTLAEAHGTRAVCVLLSGGDDGAKGLRRVKENGGAVFVQRPDQAALDEMPRGTIASELVDEVLPAAAIPGRIAAYRASLSAVAAPAEATGAREPISPADLHLRLLEQYAPPSVVIDQDCEVVRISPRAARYLRVRAGEPSASLLQLILPELHPELSAALDQAAQLGQSVDTQALPVRLDERLELVTIRVRPGDPAQGYVLVLFEPSSAAAPDGPMPAHPDEPVARRLEAEVRRLQQLLRRSSAQYELRADELKAANEGLLALNDALRSSSEGLEAHKGELQAINEGLRTAIDELTVKVEEATVHSANLQNLVNSTEVGTIFLDRQLRIKLFTPEALALFDLSPADYGRPLSAITHQLIEVEILAEAEAVLARSQTVEREVRTAGGRTYLLRTLPYRTGRGRIDGVVLTFFDISERKGAEAQVRAALEAEQMARLAAEAASNRTAQLQAVTVGLADALTPDAVIEVITRHGVVATGASAAVVGLLDSAGERLDVAGRIGHDAAAAERHLLPLRAQAPPAAAARRGEPIWLSSREEAEARFPGFGAVLARFGDHALASLPLASSGRVLGTLSFSYPAPTRFSPDDQTFLLALAQQCAQALERARLYAELLASQEQLRKLSQRLIEAQEEERRHLARELHDEVGQELTGLRLALELAGRLPAEQRDTRLAEAHRTAQELIAKIRALSLDLRPAMLDDAGLLPALLWQLRRYRERTGITVELRHQGLERRLPAAVETVAYRVVQEALTNIARHAGVDSAMVDVLSSPAQLLVQVRDAGRGFVPDTGLSGGRSSGLAGMRERVALLGGTLTIDTQPGVGTWVTVELPLGEDGGP